LVGQVWASEGHDTLQVSKIKCTTIHCHTWRTTFSRRQTLPPSDDEDEGQVVRSAKRFAPNQEVLMIHADEDCEGLEWVQLDDYDNYLLDPLEKDVDATMDSVSPASIKAEDADDI
jgi:hypothetical protein